MAWTPPTPAGQPLDATRTAAGQVVTLAGAQAVAVQAAACLTVAALLWPLIPAPAQPPAWPAHWASSSRCARSRSSRPR